MKRRPDITESVKQFAENCGVGAQIRMRSEIGSMGFNISEVHDFVKTTFFSESQDFAPSKSTLRRLFSAPFQNRKAASYYHEVIKARPCAKRNDLTVGKEHAHRRHYFTLVKMAREFGSKHSTEVTTMSCDDK